MYCAVNTATIMGIEAVPVEVQVHIASGLPSLQVVGLPDVMVQESRERVRAALKSSGFSIPANRITVNLAPAALRKHGCGFDLPIAAGIAVASGQVDPRSLDRTLLVGELGLDGSLVPVAGDLAFAALAKRMGATLVAPSAGGASRLVGSAFRSLTTLSELRSLGEDPGGCAGLYRDDSPVSAFGVLMGRESSAPAPGDLADVAGQERAVRALATAAVGGHNVLLIGPPGTGKTMLARRFTTLLPPMTEEESLETLLIHSVAGMQGGATYGNRPFRDPHHSTTTVGLVGGGNPPHPGEVSLAHNGVLFLDELPQFGPAALQSLRGPLEDRFVTIVRAEIKVTYPASFALIAAANPCPCGYHGDAEVACRCSPPAVARYLGRIGGPLLDRFDLVVRVDRPDPRAVLESSGSGNTAQLAAEVSSARMTPEPALSRAAARTLERAARSYPLSPRATVRTGRVAASIARLAGAESVTEDHIFEALSLRVAL